MFYRFQKLELEENANCRYDHVTIFDGLTESASNTVMKLCGMHRGELPSVVTPGSTARILFKSDGGFEREGFTAAVEFTHGMKYQYLF